MALSKLQRRQRIKLRIRKIISGTTTKPRLVVFRSNKEIYAQLVDDVAGKTFLAVSSKDKEVTATGAKIDIAKTIGKLVGERALAAGFTTCAFDRNGYLYHGRVKALADGAREAGLKF